MKLLEVRNIHKKEGREEIINAISFSQNALQNIAIAGESGSGKTTLLKIIAGLIQPDEGQVLFQNKKVEGPFEKLIPGHPRIAYLSQHFELRNHYRVEEILDYSNKLPETKAKNLYKVCRIDHLLKRWTNQLSGGERQRIALAIALISMPDLLLLDEPFSNLDLIHRDILKDVIRDLRQKMNITCLMTSHDPNDILSLAEEIYIIKKGTLIQHGTPEDIYRYPVNEYSAGLFGKFIHKNSAMINLFPGLSAKNNLNYLRPEDFRIVQENNGSVQGIVNDISFMGSHHEIEINIAGIMLTIRTINNGVAKGERVFIALAD